MCTSMLDNSRDRIPFWLRQLSHRFSVFLYTSKFSSPLSLSLLGPTSNKTFKATGKSRKSQEWKQRLAGSQLETSKFGGTHISVWIKFAYASEKSGSIDSKSSSSFVFLLLLRLGCRGCWLCGSGSVWLLEFKLIVDWQRFPPGLRLCRWKLQDDKFIRRLALENINSNPSQIIIWEWYEEDHSTQMDISWYSYQYS